MTDFENQPCPNPGCDQKSLLDEGRAQVMRIATAGAMRIVRCAHGQGWHAVPATGDQR